MLATLGFGFAALTMEPLAASATRAQAESSPAPATAAAPRRIFDHVIAISVDGLRSDALIAGPREALPNFNRLLDGGASTLNARTDPDFTVTLPNHTGMLTGCTVRGKDGHAWTTNDEPAPGATLHGNRGRYVPCMFDVAHDRGLYTAMYVAKTKFVLYDQSYDAEHGAADTTGDDQGRDKLDEYACNADDSAVTTALLAGLSRSGRRSLAFVHYASLDRTGHASGWDLTPGSKYCQATAAVDAQIGRLLAAIDADANLRGKTAIVLTADHGGGAPFKSHDLPHMWVDYIIPFVVWTDASGGRIDLYSANASTRREPALSNPPADAGLPPLRNADVANVCLMLLGLPAVPGSTVGAAQDLDVYGTRDPHR